MLLLATMAFGQAKEDAGDGKMLDTPRRNRTESKSACGK